MHHHHCARRAYSINAGHSRAASAGVTVSGPESIRDAMTGAWVALASFYQRAKLPAWLGVLS